jgi:hypothetical protein
VGTRLPALQEPVRSRARAAGRPVGTVPGGVSTRPAATGSGDRLPNVSGRSCTPTRPVRHRSRSARGRRRPISDGALPVRGIPARTSAPGFVALRCRDRWRPGVLADVLLGPVDSELFMYPTRERGFSPVRLSCHCRVHQLRSSCPDVALMTAAN